MGYHRSDMRGRYYSTVGGLTTSLRPTPARYRAILAGASETEFLRVCLILVPFESGDALGEFHFGAQSIEVEAIDHEGAARPTRRQDLRAVSVPDLLVRAVRRWAWNDDASPVTYGQARAMTRAGVRRSGSDGCDECNGPIVGRRADARFCSGPCRQRAFRRRGR